MLDRFDFESWQQRIPLYCLGKENGKNILQSIDEGPFKMGMFRKHLLKVHFIKNQNEIESLQTLHQKKKERNKANIRAIIILFQGGQTNTFDDDVDEAPVQDLALNKDNVFQANQSDLIYDEAGPSYDSNILSEVQDHDNYLDSVDEYHEVHEIHNDVQQNYVVNSDAEYMSDSNIIPYDQYVKNNAEQVVQSKVSYVPSDALIMIINDIHDQAAQYVSANEQNKVVNVSLTAKLVRYKEQVAIYKKGDTLEIAETNRKKILKKMKSHVCVEKRVKIAPPDYSK
nr:hypothetical protein [Tanacetum cinerariifolium]